MTKTTSLLTALGLSVSLAAPLAAYEAAIIDRGSNEADDRLRLDTVTAQTDGVIEIYDFRLGFQGEALGATTVHAGANSDVRVPLSFRPNGDVLAVLYDASGAVTAREIIAID